ncbi:MAG: hypothetical protein HYX78_02220 [Armatimonadetes bacterium]|nr:hypothetical protein [Armatimonadota bacterium]
MSARFFVALVVPFLLAVYLPVGASPSLEVSLNGDWDFCYKTDLKTDTLPDAKDYDAKMPIPAFWDDNINRLRWTANWSGAKFNPKYRNIEFPMGIGPPDVYVQNLMGTGYYRKLIDVPADWKGRAASLYIGGVRLTGLAWLNGQYLGEHKTYNVPWELNISQHIKPGQTNELVLAATNLTSGSGGCDTYGYQYAWAGVYRPVTLRVSGGPARVADLYVYPQDSGKRLCWNVELDGAAGAGASIDWLVLDQQGGALGRGTTQVTGARCTWTTDTFDMKPWSDHEPNLYKLQVDMKQREKVTDSRLQNFGLRTIVRDGINLRLNGRPVMLRGCCDAFYFPLTCMPPLEIEAYRDRIRKLKELGFNWIRCHTWVPTEEYMTAADELGIMIQVEGPGPTYYEPRFVEILRTCRKHPSVIMYCTGNEYVMDEKVIEFVQSLSKLTREYAPDALFDPMECLIGVFGGRGPNMGVEFTEEPYPHNPKRLKLLQEAGDVLAPNGGLSYATTGADWKDIDKRFALCERPVLYHELCIHGNYMNLDIEHRYEGTRIGTELYAAIRRHLAENGVLDKASTYYYNSCQWMKTIRKHCVETARLSKYITGYDMLGAWDQHWHRSGYPCGILNEFFEMKPGESEADVRKYNGESVILLDCTQKRNLASGQKCSFDVKSSLYGDAPLSKGTFTWHLSDDHGRIYDRGSITLREVRNGEIVNLGAIKFTAPNLSKPAKLTIHARLSGGEYEIVNDWNFWAFPKSASPEVSAAADSATLSKYGECYKGLVKFTAASDRELAVLSELSADAIKFLAGGGRVVLLGSKPFPTMSTGFDPCPTGRAEGNLATVVNDHPITNVFPNDGWCDWQFYSMLTGGKAVVFNEIDIPFDPIIEVVSSFKHIRKQANLFELGVGKGKLLVCTMNLDMSDPGAECLLDSTLNYATSNSFQPGRTILAASLAKLLGADPKQLGLPEIDPTMDSSLTNKK